MTAERCPFCKQDPFEYVDVGVGFVPVAITCCDLGVALYGGDPRVKRVLKLRRSPAPRSKARAKRLLEKIYSS